MRKPLVAGNWKMNGSSDSARSLVDGIKEGVAAGVSADVAICPPFVYLSQVAALLEGSNIALGAQDVSQHQGGAYTGEIAPAMLLDMGCEYVILGHSERRSYYGEDDALVAEKVIAAHGAGLRPMLCIGETLQERESDQTEAVVARQLDVLLNTAEGLAALQDGVIAYEPVWAIGTGKTASPQQAQDVHAFIRGRIAAKDADLAGRMRILYGGSVKGDNAAELFAMADIDGGLIGGASLKVDDFLTICRAAQ